MIVATLLWSMAGVVTRHLESANGVEATFWRSFFNAVALLFLLARLRGSRALAKTLLSGDRTLWLSGLCWAAMFTAFMVAITMTTVANVLVTMAIAPLVTALFARFALGHRLPLRTWAAIVVAGMGIAWMYAHELAAVEGRHVAGTMIALAVPLAAALNWTAIQRSRSGSADLLAAVLIGATLSALLTFGAALPMRATAHDLALLAVLGVFQLAVPCLIAVAAARVLAAAEAALLSLLEVVFGVCWTWLGAAEAPSRYVLVGGALVIGALVANESIALQQRRVVANAT
ncbi:MAG TPA: DMT family transporter [Caldimonas sp.]|jgi:drug/metabolite transporter (DMT)-like permease|nr:DMT family transporter [Caldimonas sp.]HEX4235789.1 DMT family transporter [Caldimonas sp.]